MKIQIPGFWGGLGNSAYEPLSTQTYQDSRNLDVFKFTRKLTSGNNMVEKVLDPVIATAEISTFYPASDGKIYLIGDTGTSNRLRLHSSTIGPTYSLTTEFSSSVNSSHPTPYVDGNTSDGRFHIAELNDYLLFWEGTLLSNYKISTDTAASDPYSWTHGGTTGPLFVHEGLRKAFICVDNKIYTLDSTTVAGSADPVLALTVDPKYKIKSLCDFGRYVAVGCQAKWDTETSKVFIWDGSATAVDDMMDVGDVGLQAVRNVNGILHVLVCRFTFGDLNNYTRIYLGDGSRFRLADELIMTSTPPTTITGLPGTKLKYLINDSAVTVSGDRMYWSYNGFYNQASYTGLLGITNGVYCYGKLEVNQPRVLTLLATTATSMGCHNATCLKVINNNIYITYAGYDGSTLTYHWENQLDNYVSSTLTPGLKSSGGVYETNIFPIGNEEGTKLGKINKITIQHDSLPASCGFTVQIKHYGHYPIGTSVPSADSYADLATSEGSGSSSGITQSTTNTTYTVIQQPNLFKEATHASIKIKFDEVSGTSAPAIVFPIIIETE